MAESAASLPYHEPSITQILVLASFFLALNVINSILDKTLYCGLVGQVLVGIAWGTPGGKWLSPALEDAVVQIGYLGLIMIVFDGGLSTSVKSVKANLLLSACVALTGIAAPMGLSFFLGPMVGATTIQSFAAGAALCATSLGTTFTVLSTSGLASTRLGSVLSTAAMMDDVVGLVMVQVVSGLGGDSGGSSGLAPAVVVRPVLVSLAFAILLPLACRYGLRPLMKLVERQRLVEPVSRFDTFLGTIQAAFVVQTTVIFALVVGAAYAGASVLLAAYLAGIMVSWWNAANLSLDQTSPSSPSSGAGTSSSSARTAQSTHEADPIIGAPISTPETPSEMIHQDVYDHYYSQAVTRVLKPFFFASIGFSIPISKMFSGQVVWRGIIYSILMALGKSFCGLWLVRFPVSLGELGKKLGAFVPSRYQTIMRWVRSCQTSLRPKERPADCKARIGSTQASTSQVLDPVPIAGDGTGAQPSEERLPNPMTGERPMNPLSLYPAGIMSFAMIARGEIGFLISSVAESKGIFRGQPNSTEGEEEASEIFLIVTWAIVLCTIVGPLCVGLLVKRVKKLESASAASQVEGEKRNVLGVWGVQ